jgi:hypothetical protein
MYIPSLPPYTYGGTRALQPLSTHGPRKMRGSTPMLLSFGQQRKEEAALLIPPSQFINRNRELCNHFPGETAYRFDRSAWIPFIPRVFVFRLVASI